MDALSGIAEIFRDLLIFIAVMTALLIALIVIISRMPTDNPLKHVLTALSYRVAATVAAGAVAIPIEPIPGLDVLYDIGVLIALIWYWFTFFKDMGHTRSGRVRSKSGRRSMSAMISDRHKKGDMKGWVAHMEKAHKTMGM